MSKESIEPTTVEFDEESQTYKVSNATDGAIPGVDFEVHGDHFIEPINETEQANPGDPTAANHSVKVQRLLEIKQAIQADIQPILAEASAIQKQISASKTATKKKFYEKKFNKIKQQTLQYVSTLQQIDALLNSEGTTNDNDETAPE